MTKADKTKAFIIERTAPVFNAKGFAGTSINDLIEVTGLTKGSIYGNFENKDAVALAAFDYNFEMVISYLKKEMSKKNTVVERLLVYPKTYRNYFKLSFLSAGCPIANTSTEADDTHPMLKEKAAHALEFWRNSVERHLKQGIANKEIKANININQTVGVITALIQGAILHAKVSGKINFLNASMNYLEDMIIDLRQ
ncbi:MAG TPA: TetR/AcrR family transcriptional regulator [Bacteroidia bacterium]|nr:TetR/AcrR family transcriptional regulator [Bacteroidia bacterium]